MLIADILSYVEQILSTGCDVIYAQKIAAVKIRRAKVGDKVTTRLKDGHIETYNFCRNEEDIVVLNPNGEEYIIPYDKFMQKYTQSSEDSDCYFAKSEAQKFIILAEDIEFYATWGELMSMHKGDFLNITDKNDVYGVAKSEFLLTYRIISAIE